MFGLSDRTITLLQNYFRQKKDVREVRVYGSRAMGTEEKGSDIDLVIFSNAKRDLSGHVKAELENLSTPYIFDVIDYAHIQNAGLKEHIDSVSKVLFEGERLRELDVIPDSKVDTSALPKLDEEFFKNAKLVMPEPKKAVSLRLDRDVLDWFKKGGKGYQSRMNAVLKAYMEAQRNV